MQPRARVAHVALALLAMLVACTPDEPATAPPPERDTPGTQQQRVSQAELPHFVPATPAQTSLLRDAQLALLNGNNEAAFEHLDALRNTQALSLAKRDGVLLYTELLEQRERLPEAVEILRDFATKIPPSGDVFFVLARMHVRRGELAEAERALRDATRASPELLRAWVALAEVLEEAGQRDEANETMIHYERQVYRLGRIIERGGTLEERTAAIRQLRVALPDPRVSRILAAALQNDAFEVQAAALDALEFVGSENAIPVVERYRAQAPSRALQDRAAEVLEAISAR